MTDPKGKARLKELQENYDLRVKAIVENCPDLTPEQQGENLEVFYGMAPYRQGANYTGL